jgi:NADH-quinone oxidoreductase subunit L
MLVPIVVLAGLAAVGGLLNLPYGKLDFLHQFLEPAFEGAKGIKAPTTQKLTAEALSLLMALIGVTIAVLLYRRGLRSPDRDPLVDRLRPVSTLTGNAYYWDAGVTRFVGGPGQRGASWLDRVFDARILDGAVNGTAWLVERAGRLASRVQDGYVRRYALGILLGTVAVICFVLLWAGR